MFGRRAANLRRRLGFDGMFYVDCEGRSGGLALLWRDTWQVRFRSSSCSHIDVDVISDSGDKWQFTGPSYFILLRLGGKLIKLSPVDSVSSLYGRNMRNVLELLRIPGRLFILMVLQAVLSPG
ncbi:hypothetical protein TIFTF001_035140 [Ficus carica]|uniref:Uncharacterized protein n=1 Tax=Ficus carica TaxID=3494 RepID=A0AA88J9Q0_FICCA|nr:hypothetical protein TIFTF001_035140 [Ficus carica]